MRKFVIGLVCMLCMFGGKVFADTVVTPVVAPQTVTITEVINAMGGQAGYFYGFRAGHGYSYLATKIATLGQEKWNLSLDGGLIATSGAALTVDYDLMNGLSLKKVPVLGFFDNIKVGGGVMVTDLTVHADSQQMNGVDNRLDVGLDTLFSKKF